MLLKLSNFICSDKKDRYRWIGPQGVPRENVRNLAGRHEPALERWRGALNWAEVHGGENISQTTNYFLKIVSIAQFCTPTLISPLVPIFVQSLAWLVQFRTSTSWKVERVLWSPSDGARQSGNVYSNMFDHILCWACDKVHKVQVRWFQTASKEIEVHRGQIKL